MNQLSPLPVSEEPSTEDTQHQQSVEEAVVHQQIILKFSSIVGQNLAVSLLKGAIAKQHIAPAYLFAGPKGVGKSLAAKCFLAEAFSIHNLANDPDLLWVEPTYLHQGQLLGESELASARLQPKSAPQIRIEQIREITQFLSRSPLVAPRKAVVIEDAEKIGANAANALLKTLEEPTSGTIILLCDQPQRLLPTITSRCQPLPFYRLSCAQMTTALKKLGQEDILSNPTVMMMAAGSPGQAIAHHKYLKSIPQSLLEQLTTPFSSPLDALNIAKEIEAMLEFHQQLWLLDYLQQCWRFLGSGDWLSKLEQAKAALLNASPRLVWEVLLLQNS